ncbi:MAG: hypothetical protein V1663_04425 [archaeon]
MATVMDIRLLQYILPVFSFLFIWLVTYAVMDKFNLAKSTSVKLLVSFCIAMLFIFSSRALRFVNIVTPWFVVMVIVALFLIALFMFMGVKEEVIGKSVGDPRVYWTVIIIAIILLIIALIDVFGDVQSPYGNLGDNTDTTTSSTSSAQTSTSSPTRQSEGLNTIVHPRVLGALFLLVASALAANFISRGLKAA